MNLKIDCSVIEGWDYYKIFVIITDKTNNTETFKSMEKFKKYNQAEKSLRALERMSKKKAVEYVKSDFRKDEY